MRKRWRIVLVMLVTVIAAGLAIYLRAPREPVYEGKPLSFWLRGYDSDPTVETSRRQADQAVAGIGTNAIPALLKLLEAKDSALKSKLRAVVHWLPFNDWDFPEAQQKHQRAVAALEALGDDARSAVLPMVAIYERDKASHGAILLALFTLGPRARDAGPFLVKWTLNHDYSALTFTTWFTIRPPPELAVPALITLLSDPVAEVRAGAAWTLRFYGSASAPALPVLDHLRKQDPDPGVRQSADKAYESLTHGWTGSSF